MTEVTVKGVSLAYQGAEGRAVADVTMTLPSGQITALLGPSGCGKTTVMKMIAGLLAPDTGDILFDGASVRQVATERRGAVMVFQNNLLFPHMSVADNISFGLRMRGQSRGEVADKVDRMLGLVRLDGFGARRPSELSGGQQQRVALARALIVGPRVLLLDEPLSSLDAHLRDDLRDMIRTLQRETGVTMLFVTHDQEEAAQIADHVTLMFDGRVRQSGQPEDFYARPTSREVAVFFGGRNFIAAHILGQQAETPLGGLSLQSSGRDGPATLTIRPEAIGLGPGPNAVQATVVRRSYLGASVRVDLLAHGQSLTWQGPPQMADDLTEGAEVAVHLPPDALWRLPEG